VTTSDPLVTRSACVISGATPEEVARIGSSDAIAMRPNKLGTLVTGRPGELVIDYAAELERLVDDIMYSAKTGWFSVTVYRGLQRTVRWDNRPAPIRGFARRRHPRRDRRSPISSARRSPRQSAAGLTLRHQG
jgi:hypothetical protein